MLIKRTLVLLLIFLPGFLMAQVNVSPVNTSMNVAGQEGIIYALPRALIEVKVVVTESTKKAGPLRNYAEEFLGVDDYIRSDGKAYEVSDISINTSSEPDPEQYFFISMADKTSRESWKTLLNMNGSGLLASLISTEDIDFEEIQNQQKDRKFEKYAMFNRYARVDTIVRTINIDTITIQDYTFKTTYTDLPLELKAEELAKKIEKIRDDRYNLITGYQEINYSEGTMQLMNDELKKLEQEYLNLFLGVVTKKQLTYTFRFLPEAETAGQEFPLFRMSASNGVSGNGSGEQATIRVVPAGNTAGLNDQKGGGKGIFYRLPDQARVEIVLGGKVIEQARVTIPQYGNVAVLPKAAYDIELDPDTGGLRSLKLDAE